MTPRQIRQTILLVLGLTLVLVSLTYSSLLQRGYVVVKFATLLVGVTALLGLGTYLVAVGRRGRELRDPLIYLLFAELGVMLYSVAFSGQAWVSFLGSITRLMGAITIACFVVAGLAVILAVGERRERLLVLLRVVAGTAALAALNAVFEWPSHHELRAPGLVGNAEFLSNYLLFGALGGLGLVFAERKQGWAIFGIVTSALAAVAMSICKTRGAWLGYGAGVAVLLLFVTPRHFPAELAGRIRTRMALLLGATFAAALLAALWGYASAKQPMGYNLLLPFLPVAGALFFALPWLAYPLRFVRHAALGLLVVMTLVTGLSVKYQLPILPIKAAEALRVTQESARGVVRDDTARMIGKYWLVGCGIENFRVAFLEFKSEKLARYDPRVNYRNPHHMMYYEWATSGLPGVLVFLGLLGVAVLWLLRARKMEKGSEWGLVASALLATLAAYTLQNFFNYDVIPTGLHYYVFLGMAVVLYRTAGKDLEGAVSSAAAEPKAPDEEQVVEDHAAPTDGSHAEEAPSGPAPTIRGKKKKAKLRITAAATTPRKEARRLSRRDVKGDRRRTREMDEREERLLRCARWLAIGLIGVTALYLLLHVLPGLKDSFRFWAGADAAPARRDGLAIALLTLWAGAWAAAALTQTKAESRVRFLVIGLGGFAVGYAAFYLVPPTRDLLQGVPEEGSPRAREDVLPGILLLSWVGMALVAAFSREEIEGRGGTQGEDTSLGRQNSLALGLLLAVLLGTGSWWAGQQLKADYHMYRAMAFSQMASGPINQIQQIQDSFRQIAGMQQRLRQQGQADQAQRYEQRKQQLQVQQALIAQRLERFLDKVLYHGRLAAKSLDMLGYYHFQYSKALHPFLKAKTALPNGEAILEESLRHAQKSVSENTNPESAWSHLAVVFLAKRDLQRAKAALARSIQFDPFYYDTHRMMALLHLQDGRIDDAEREIHRSLDITAGKHFHFSWTALHQVLTARRKGDDVAADKARAQMWHWLIRGMNFPDLPIPLLQWWGTMDSWEALRQLASTLTAATGRPSAAALQETRRMSFRGVSRHHQQFYRAIREILFGEPAAATSLLLGLNFGAPPMEETLEGAINLLGTAARVDSDLERLEKLGQQAGRPSPQVERALDSLADRLIDQDSRFYARVSQRLASMLEEGDTSSAKKLAALSVSLFSKLHQAQLEDPFSNEFRRAYAQVLTARSQVMEAASPQGRLARAESFLARRSPSIAFRITEQALARFPKGPPKLHYLRAASLDSMGRIDEALTSYDTYLKLAPDGDRAERARQRMQAIHGQ